MDAGRALTEHPVLGGQLYRSQPVDRLALAHFRQLLAQMDVQRPAPTPSRVRDDVQRRRRHGPHAVGREADRHLFPVGAGRRQRTRPLAELVRISAVEAPLCRAQPLIT